MFTVVLIGADGAGKTTIAKQLPAGCPLPTKYLYMGPNIESSNIALPTSRLVLHLKLWSYKRTAKRKGITDPSFISTHHNAHRKVQRGRIGATLRMFNRLLEGMFRQLISWIYQLRGFIVIYDRHLLFEADNPEEKANPRLTDRIYYWILTNIFPQPELVIFLDAPPEVLFERKGEGTLPYLQHKREICIAHGQKAANFVTIDATQSLDVVFKAVCQEIMAYHSTKNISQQVNSRQARKRL